MKCNAFGVLLGLTLMLLVSGAQAQQDSGGTASVAGAWEGPWYRGMTSGKVKIQVEGAGGTIQFTNLDNFGDAPHLLTHTAFDGKVLQLRAEGEKGGPLTAALKLDEAGTQMKGMGKFDGFPLRFEVKRAPAQ